MTPGLLKRISGLTHEPFLALRLGTFTGLFVYKTNVAKSTPSEKKEKEKEKKKLHSSPPPLCVLYFSRIKLKYKRPRTFNYYYIMPFALSVFPRHRPIHKLYKPPFLFSLCFVFISLLSSLFATRPRRFYHGAVYRKALEKGGLSREGVMAALI